MFGIRIIETAAGIPFGALVAMGRDPPGIFYHSCHVHEIPGHEGRIAVGKIILLTAGTRPFKK